MELKLKENDMLGRIDKEEIGNGNGSRLDIYLDKSNGEVFSKEFYDCDQNSWLNFHDDDIIKIGTASNSLVEDENGNEEDNWYDWHIEIDEPNGNESNNIVIAGDGYCNVDYVISEINELYNTAEQEK